MKERSSSARSLARRLPFFYGWIIAAIGLIAAVISTPAQTNGFAVYIDHFITDLGISRSLLSSLYTVGTLLGAFAQPLIGRLTDSRGARTLLVAVSMLFALACVYMGTVQNALMLGIGFTFMRGLGQGSLGLITNTTTNRWWVRRRGLVQGLVGMLSSFIVGGYPILANRLIEGQGWRVSYFIIGGVVAAVMLPLALLLNRSRPEDEGLLADGVPLTGKPNAPGGHPPEENWTLTEARHTGIFWVMLLGMTSTSLLGTGLTFHAISIFADSGLSAALAAAVFVPVGVVGAAVRLGSGALVNKVPLRYMLAVSLLGMVAQLIIAPSISSITMAYTYGVIMGLQGGIGGTVWTVGWADYFGREHLGEITGFVSVIMLAGSALGPMPMALARDLLGSYRSVLLIGALFPAVIAVACLLVKEPHRRQAAFGGGSQ